MNLQEKNIFTKNQEYVVNRRVAGLVKIYIPFGLLAIFGSFFMNDSQSFRILGWVFICVALVANYKFPEKIFLSKKNIGVKTVLSKKMRSFELNELKLTTDKKGKKFYLKLDRKYIVSLAFIPEKLFHKLKKYLDK